MASFEIVTDSACDFKPHEYDEIGVKMVPFTVSTNGKEFLEDWNEMDPDKFVNGLLDNPSFVPKTATPSPELYIKAFEHSIENGKDVLCLCATQTLTSVIRTAEAAKKCVMEKFPNAKIEVMDSQLLSVAQSAFVLEAVKLRDNGLKLDEAVAKLLKARNRSVIFFYTMGTKYLHLGGRIGKVGAIATGLLNIKPLIVLKMGEISPFGATRSRKSGTAKIVEAAKNYLAKEGIKPHDVNVTFGSSFDIKDEIENLKALTKKELGITVDTPPTRVGAVVVAHTGPGIVGISLVCKA